MKTLDLNKLNPAQRRAVETLEGPLLVVAGAGSGKTRVLTHRIVHMIESGTALPGEICAVTFTNKAAGVMRERVSQLLARNNIPSDELLISTFHSLGAKLLRLHGYRIGLSPGFTIYDSSDQQSLIKDCMERLQINDKVVSPRMVASKLDQLKNDGIDPLTFEASSLSFVESRAAPVIRLYEQQLRANNAVDFGDLILKTLMLFRQDEDFRSGFQERYRFLLVDEYQDTNAAQYQLLRQMTERHHNICVVGDEDQSIYAWRGADIRNILEFEKDFPSAQVVKLEENYRSTGHIVKAASEVVSHNSMRKEKALFTSLPDGEPIQIHHVESDFEEARFVVRQIQQLTESGTSLNDVAIFYRTNAQSRNFEDRLRAERIPYRIFGGMKFYDRAEIKDAIAYLRCLVNPRDEVALMRIINVPTRGLGKTTLDAVREFAIREKLPYFEALGLVASQATEGQPVVGSGPRKKIQAFLDLYGKLAAKLGDYAPLDFYGFLMDETGYIRALEADNTVEAQSRIENLKEFGTVLSEWQNENPEAPIDEFLESVALVSGEEGEGDESHFVSLMTIHASKGLEFDTVFIVGCEEELFPSVKPDSFGQVSKDDLEEERRLCYVAMTRAMRRLVMTDVRIRRVYGVPGIRRPSRFYEEIPEIHRVEQNHVAGPARSSFFSRRQADSFDSDWGDGGDAFGGAFSQTPQDGYQVGILVQHPDYGQGTIVSREGQAEGLKVGVRFTQAGLKKFVVKFAPLTLLS